MEDNFINNESKTKINFLKTQAERMYYLEEFKENVSLALTEEQLNSDIVYQEIFIELKEERTLLLKMRRDIPLKKLKPYIMEAERLGVKYTLIDSLNLMGNIALVVVVREPFDNDDREIVLENIDEKFEKRGLLKEYPKYFGEKLCEKHYNLVKEKMSEYLVKYGELSIFDRIFGKSCPICKLEKEKEKKW